MRSVVVGTVISDEGEEGEKGKKEGAVVCCSPPN